MLREIFYIQAFHMQNTINFWKKKYFYRPAKQRVEVWQYILGEKILRDLL